METSIEFADMQHTSACWHEKNDCSVKALAIALDIRYADAWYTTRRCGRKYQKGMPIEDFFMAVLSKLRHVKQVEYTGPTGNFIRKFREGTFILGHLKHVYVYKDGTMHDDTLNWESPIITVWQIL